MYKILNDFSNDDFFKDNVSKRCVQVFQKRRYVQKIFGYFKIYVQRNMFQ